MNAPVPVSVWETLLFRMRSLRGNIAASVRGIRWPYAGIAFCLAVTLWYVVTVHDKVESWVDAQVVFRNAPDNLVISDGLINKVSVRVRAAQGLSRSLTGRDRVVVVDLSSITRGSNAIPITRDILPFSTAFEVIEVVPPRVMVVADTVTSREIALDTRFVGRLGPDLFVNTLTVTPPKVTARGADTIISGLSQIRIPVPLTLDTPRGHSTVSVAVPAPQAVAVEPPQVTVDLEVSIRTRQVRVTRTVYPAGDESDRKFAISPDRVTIVAELPESIARNEAKLAAITAGLQLPQGYGGEKLSLPIAVTLPENASLVSVTPAQVTVAAPKR